MKMTANLTCPAMCNFTTHISARPFCKSKETILISEMICAGANTKGASGSCGILESKISETFLKCWKCRDDVDENECVPERDRPSRRK